MSNAVLLNFYARWLGAPQPSLRNRAVPNHRGHFVEQVIPTRNSQEGQPLDAYGVNVSKHLEVTQRHTAVMASFIALMRAKGYTCYPEAYIRDVN